MNIDAIILDLYGTLWDSCRVVSESWGETLRQLGCTDWEPKPETVKSIMGMTAEEIAAALFSQYGAKSREICRQCIHEENAYIARHGGDLYPGVGETLAALSETLPLFIVSNCLEGYIECFLDSSGLGPLFRDHVCEGDTGLKKAGNIALLARRHGLRCPAYVGDTASDERSAREAGCAFVFASYGFGEAERPDAVIASFSELPAAIDALKGDVSHA
jgi:phosphoglycolate phosphatase